MTLPIEVRIEDIGGPASARLRLWRDVVGDHMADVDLTPTGDLSAEMTLRGSLWLRIYDSASLARISAGAQALHRTSERIRRSPSNLVFVNFVTSGSCRLDQLGRRETITPGGLCLYDTSAPYRIETSFDFASVLVGIPREAIRRRVGDVRPAVGAFSPGPASTVAACFWQALARDIGSMYRVDAEALIESGIDVLATAIRSGLGRDIASSGDAAVERAKRAIRQGHSIPGFSAGDVATAVGLSLRRLQELFQREGDTVATALLRARLEHARQLLADPRFDRMSIKALMSRTGFADPAHFSRVFKKAYLLGPEEFRRRRRKPFH